MSTLWMRDTTNHNGFRLCYRPINCLGVVSITIGHHSPPRGLSATWTPSPKYLQPHLPISILRKKYVYNLFYFSFAKSSPIFHPHSPLRLVVQRAPDCITIDSSTEYVDNFSIFYTYLRITHIVAMQREKLQLLQYFDAVWLQWKLLNSTYCAILALEILG